MPAVDGKAREQDRRDRSRWLALRGSGSRWTRLDLCRRQRVVRDNGRTVFRDDKDSCALGRVGSPRMPSQPFIERRLTAVEVVELVFSS